MTNWKLQDYLDFYEERAAIIGNDNDIRNLSEIKIKNLAWIETKEYFIDNENIADESILSRMVIFLREFIYK